MAIPPDQQRWIVTLPPEGAARQVGEETWRALSEVMPDERRKLFDTKAYLAAYDSLLKNPDDDMVVDLLNQSLAVQAFDFEATHVLVLALSPVTAFTSNLLRRRGIVTAHWFYEDFRQAKYWRNVLGSYRHFLAIQRGPVEAACREQGVRYHYLPTAAAGGSAAPTPWRDRTGGLVFVGFPSPYRAAVLEALDSAGLPLKVAGSGWEKYRGPLQGRIEAGGWTGPEQARALLDSAKAGLHIPFEDPAVDRDNSHISPRVFDILASGAVLACEDAPLIRETLRGCAWREFRGPAQAVEACRAALAEGLPQAALDANRATVLREHSYRRRVEYLQSLDPA